MIIDSKPTVEFFFAEYRLASWRKACTFLRPVVFAVVGCLTKGSSADVVLTFNYCSPALKSLTSDFRLGRPLTVWSMLFDLLLFQAFCVLTNLVLGAVLFIAVMGLISANSKALRGSALDRFLLPSAMVMSFLLSNTRF